MTTTWMPIYWGSYFKKTFHLTTEEHGAYFLLMGYYWQNGKIPRDITLLKNITQLSEKKLTRVMKFFSIDGAFYTHERIDEEIQKAIELKEKKAAAGRKGMANRYNRASNSVITELVTNEQQTPNPLPLPLPLPVTTVPKGTSVTKNIYPPEFELFWKTYPPNKASKAESFKAFQKAIKEVNHDDIIRAAGSYRADIERTGNGVQYTAHATTWLNQRRWTIEYEQLERGSSANGSNAKAKVGGSGKSALAEQVERVKAKILGSDIHSATEAGNAMGKQRIEIEGANPAGVLLDDVKFVRQENG